MNNKLKALIAIMLLLSCNFAKQLRQTPNDLMVQAAGLEFKAYYSKHYIPRDLYGNYRRLYKEGKLMADSSEEFNPIDVQVKNVPDRRFIFGANSISNVYELFVYEEGGVGLKNFCIISKREEGGEGVILRVYLFRRASDIDELKEIIAKKEYSISNRN